MTKFVNLEEAARMLGMSPEQLVEARDRNEIHGYRDGASWKFKVEEVERYRKERGAGPSAEEGLPAGDLLGEDEEDLVLLADEPDQLVTQSPSTVIGSSSAKPSADSDIRLAASDPLLDIGSSGLSGATAEPETAESDVRLVVNGATSDVKVEPSSSSALAAGAGSPGSSELELELGKVASTGTGDLPGSDEIAMDTDALSLSDEEELMLAASGTGSDVGLGSDTGINLAHPSDSGISLDEEPIELGAVSSLELPEDEELPAAAAEEVELVADEEFQLEPGPLATEEEESSASQVIDLEPTFGEPTGGEPVPLEPVTALEPAAEAYVPAAPPAPSYSLVNVLFLFCTVAVLALSGLLMVDVTRNMWSWSEQTDRSSASMIMDMLLNALKLNR